MVGAWRGPERGRADAWGGGATVTRALRDRAAILDGVLEQREVSMYPLELDFLWSRGAEQTPRDGIRWSVATPASHALAHAPASGPVVLAALADGRDVITAWLNGTPVQRKVTVRTGEHRTVPLERMP